MLLLDEIEKAHPDLFNILLQIMDHGRLTDHHGKTVDFRNVILIMTTNAGAADMASEGIGFGNVSKEDASEEAVKRMFTPEFRNRLDAIVPFGYLPTEVVARVVDKFILQLELQLADRNVHIELDDEARAWLTERGYDRLYGARPMGRLVQDKIKQPLAEELLFGKLVHGGEVKVRIKDNAPSFEIVAAPPKASKRKKKPPPTRRRKRASRSSRPEGRAPSGTAGAFSYAGKALSNSRAPAGLKRSTLPSSRRSQRDRPSDRAGPRRARRRDGPVFRSSRGRGGRAGGAPCSNRPRSTPSPVKKARPGSVRTISCSPSTSPLRRSDSSRATPRSPARWS